MAHRLLVCESEDIAKKLTQVKMVPELRDYLNTYRMLTDEMYNRVVPEAIANVIKQYRGWFRLDNDMKVRSENGGQQTIYFLNDVDLITEHSYFYGQDHRPVPWEGHDILAPMIDEETFSLIADYHDKITRQRSSIINARRTIVSKIRGRSVKAICEGWPEVKDIVETMTFTSSNPRTFLSVAPALNQMLGLPVTE